MTSTTSSGTQSPFASSLHPRNGGSSTRPQSTCAGRIRSPLDRRERQSNDAAASRCDLGILCRVPPETALGPSVMECIRDATHRCHVCRDTGREDGESPMFVGCGQSAGVRVEGIELRVVQVAALGWWPGCVGCNGDHAPVGGLSSTVFRKASSRLPHTRMPMSAAPALVPDRGVYVRFLRHLGSFSNSHFRIGLRQSKQAARQLSPIADTVSVRADAGHPTLRGAKRCTQEARTRLVQYVAENANLNAAGNSCNSPRRRVLASWPLGVPLGSSKRHSWRPPPGSDAGRSDRGRTGTRCCIPRCAILLGRRARRHRLHPGWRPRATERHRIPRPAGG